MTHTRFGAGARAAARAPSFPSSGRLVMLTAEMERQSCLASAEQWRRQAEQVREHAGRSYLQPRQREALLAEAEACDRQADWWVAGADDYVPAAATAGLAALLR